MSWSYIRGVCRYAPAPAAGFGYVALQDMCRQKKPARVAAPPPRDILGRCTVCGRTEQRRPPVSKRYETKVRMVWGSFLIAAAALKTPTRTGYNAQGVNLTSYRRGVCRYALGFPWAAPSVGQRGMQVRRRRRGLRGMLGVPSPSDLCPIHTLQGNRPEPSAP